MLICHRIFGNMLSVFLKFCRRLNRERERLSLSLYISGLHWTWEITRMLKLGKTDMMGSMIMEHSMIEFNKLDAVDKMASPRVFPTHMLFSQLPASFKEKKCKIIYITRDPRAVAVSFFRLFSSFNEQSGLKFEGDWEDFLPMFLDGQCKSLVHVYVAARVKLLVSVLQSYVSLNFFKLKFKRNENFLLRDLIIKDAILKIASSL